MINFYKVLACSNSVWWWQWNTQNAWGTNVISSTFETQIFLFWFTNLKVILHRLHKRSQDLPLVSCIVTLSSKDTDVWCKCIYNNIKVRML